MGGKAKSQTVCWIHSLIMVLLMCSGWFLPEGEIITEYGIRIAMIFVGCIWGWIFVGLVWPSLLSMLFLVAAGMGTAKEVVGQGFGSEIILLVIFFSIFTKWLEDIGLTSTMAKWLLSRKFLVGKSYLFVFMLFLVTFICGFFVGIYATIFLLWGICYQLLTNLGYEKRSKETTFILLGVAYVSIMGMTVKPWSPWSLMGVNGLVTATGINVEYLPYSCFMIIISLLSTVLFMLFCKVVVRVDLSKLKNADQTSLAKDIRVTRQQKLGAGLLLFLLTALYIPSVLPDCLLKTMLQAQGSTGVIILVLVILSVVQFDGKPALKLAEVAKDAVPWSMVCLLSAVGPLGAALMSGDAGITKAIMAGLKPALAGQGPMVLYILTIVVACILTQFMNNTILLVVMTPMLCTISGVVGANPVLIAAILIFGLTAALATPGASSRAGLIFGNTEWIDIKQAYVQALLSVIAVAVVLIAVGIPLGSILF